jgi:hypothetical protein
MSACVVCEDQSTTGLLHTHNVLLVFLQRLTLSEVATRSPFDSSQHFMPCAQDFTTCSTWNQSYAQIVVSLKFIRKIILQFGRNLPAFHRILPSPSSGRCPTHYTPEDKNKILTFSFHLHLGVPRALQALYKLFAFFIPLNIIGRKQQCIKSRIYRAMSPVRPLLFLSWEKYSPYQMSSALSWYFTHRRMLIS